MGINNSLSLQESWCMGVGWGEVGWSGVGGWSCMGYGGGVWVGGVEMEWTCMGGGGVGSNV